MSYFDALEKTHARGRRRALPERPVVRDILPPDSRDRPPRAVEDEKRDFARVPPEPLPPEELELPVHTWEPEGAKRRRRMLRIYLAMGAAVLLLGFSLPLAAFPLFAVTITPKVEEREVPALNIEAATAISAVDRAENRIPGVLVTVEAEEAGEYPATGRKHFAERARGVIAVMNAYSSLPQTLVAGTRFRAPGGEIFRSVRAVVVPGARVEEGEIIPQSTNVEVMADEPGDAHNLGPSEFRIPGFFGGLKYDGFTGKSTEPFREGFKGEAAVVSAEDLKKAEEERTAELVRKLLRELEARIPTEEDFLAPSGSRQTLITQIERPAAGERHDSFRLAVSGRGHMMLVSQTNLNELLTAKLFPPDPLLAALTRKQPKLSFPGVRLDAGAGRMSFSLAGTAAYYRTIPGEDIAGVMRVSTPRKIEAYLRGREEIAAFRIKKFPAWLWFIPRRTGGTQVTVEEPGG